MRDIISRNAYRMDGFILRLYEVAMAYRSQAGLPMTRLEKSGYYKAATTPGIWRQKWRSIQFFLIVDDFGIKYVGKQHALHPLKILEENYEIPADWEGGKFTEIDLAWDYDDQHAKRTCRLSTKGYIEKLLMKYGHPHPSKAHLSPHKHCEVIYGAKEELNLEEDKSLPLDKEGTIRIQGIAGALLYYARAVDNKLPVGLSFIRSQHAAATERTNEAINHLLNYSATYPSDGVLYRSRNMVLCAHPDTVFHNETKGRSRAGDQIFLSENDPVP